MSNVPVKGTTFRYYYKREGLPDLTHNVVINNEREAGYKAWCTPVGEAGEAA